MLVCVENMSTYLLKLLTIMIFLHIASGSETCLDDNGVSGECTKISNCPSAIELVKKKIPPKTCGFDGLEPIVCCKKIKLESENELFPPGCKVTYQNTFIESRIFGGGGINSLAYEFPHMAVLGFEDKNGEIVWGCGGTLITKQYVLTAAHCLLHNSLGEVKYVRLGDLDLKSNEDDAEPQNFTVIERIKHPDYRRPATYNDIGIIKLDRPCKITPYVIPACLHTKNELPNATYSATGWGQLGFGGELSNYMQNMRIKVFNHADCEKAYSKINKRRLPNGIDEKTQICAGAHRIDTCPGDSGGPLQLYRKRNNTVYGVTSFGVACVISRIPGVYTRVSAYISWIKSIIT